MKHWHFSHDLLVQDYLQKGHKEEEHRGFFVHSLHHSTVELSPFHLVWLAGGEQQVGKFPSGHS